MRKFLSLVIVSILFSSLSFAQNQTLIKGMVSEIEVTTDSTSLNYSIYIPQNFIATKPVKGLFIFDPNGDGMRASRLFVSAIAGEDYVVVSNNFKMSNNLDSLDFNANNAITIMRDVFAKVALEPSQIYIAGLGAGAKATSALSYLLKNTAGILLVDDVYFADQYIAQARKNNVIGVVGKSSPNYYQMADYFRMMKSFNSSNVLYTYSNSGEWPEASFIGVLLNRLNHIQAETINLKISDTLWERRYQNDLNGLKSLVTNKEYLTAYDLSLDLKRDYRRKVDLDAIKNFYKSLRNTESYKTAKRLDRSGNLEELLLLDDIEYFLESDIVAANFENLGYWDSRINEFKNASNDPNKPNEQKVAKRMLGYIDYTVEDFLTLNKVSLLAQRIFGNVLMTMLDSKDYQAYLNIISLSAQDNDDNTAYFYLEELLKQGFTDYDALYEIPQTTTLKIKPVYNQLIKSYLGKAKF